LPPPPLAENPSTSPSSSEPTPSTPLPKEPLCEPAPLKPPDDPLPDDPLPDDPLPDDPLCASSNPRCESDRLPPVSKPSPCCDELRPDCDDEPEDPAGALCEFSKPRSEDSLEPLWEP
jgi:hypothetical protein